MRGNKPFNYILSIVAAVFTAVALVSFFQSISVTSYMTLGATIIIMVVLYIGVFSGWTIDEVNQLPKTKRMVAFFFVLVFSGLFLLSIKGEQVHLRDNSIFIWLYVYGGAFLAIYIMVISFINVLLKEPSNQPNPKVNKRRIIDYAILPFVVFMGYFLAFYPANMSPDSFVHWEQAHTHIFNDWQPVVYTWLNMLLFQFWNSPAITALFQMVVIAALFGYCMYRCEVFGVKRLVLCIITVLFAILPFNGIYAMTIWKDILFSVSVLILCMIIYNIVVSNGDWLKSKLNINFYIITGCGVCLLRNNGFPVFVVSFIIIMMVYWKNRMVFLRVLASSVLVCVIFFLINGPLFHYLKVIPPDPNEALSIPTQQIATIIINNGNMTEEERAYFNEILPIKLWKEKFNPYITNDLKSPKYYHRDIIYNDPLTYFRNWFSIVSKNPKLATSAFLKQSSIVWEIHYPPHSYFYGFTLGVLQPNQWGLKSTVINEDLTTFFRKVANKTYGDLRPLWRPALYTFLMILFTFIGYLRNNKKIFLVILPVLLNTGTIMAATPAQDVRYLYSNLLVFFIAISFLFVKYDRRGLGNEPVSSITEK